MVVIYDLLEAIEKSNIPFLVQVHDWAMTARELPQGDRAGLRGYARGGGLSSRRQGSGSEVALWADVCTLQSRVWTNRRLSVKSLGWT